MIDFTKLRDLIIEKKCVSSSDYGKEDPFIGIYWEDLIDIINQCDSIKWISVNEALPEVDGHGYSKPILVMNDNNELLVSTYSKIHDKWNSVGPVSYHRLVVTHWMPIPEMKGGEK